MNKEEYKKTKLEELHREFPSVWDGKVVQEFLEAFLSQTIDEVYADRSRIYDYLEEYLFERDSVDMAEIGRIVYDVPLAEAERMRDLSIKGKR